MADKRLTLEDIEAAAKIVAIPGDSWHSRRRLENLTDLLAENWRFIGVRNGGDTYERRTHRLMVCRSGTTTLVISPFASRYAKTGRGE